MITLTIGEWWRQGPATYLRCPDCEAVLRADSIDDHAEGAEVVAVCPEEGKRFYVLSGWPGTYDAHLVREVCPACRGKKWSTGPGWCEICNGAGVVFVQTGAE